jgi:hypothetical protein
MDLSQDVHALIFFPKLILFLAGLHENKCAPACRF